MTPLNFINPGPNIQLGLVLGGKVTTVKHTSGQWRNL